MSQLSFPEAVRPGRQYSFRADLKLDAWAFVAAAVAFTARGLLQHHRGWGALVQSIVALSPLVPSLFYVRSISRWIDGMDELQRRIQLSACLCATIGAAFVVTGLSLLQAAEVLTTPSLKHGLGWEGMFAVIILLYVLANAVINRRYQ